MSSTTSDNLTTAPSSLLAGRSQEEWETLERDARYFLTNVARAPRLTNYYEVRDSLARSTSITVFDLREPLELAAVTYLLGRIDASLYPTTGVMLSAIVSDADKHGPSRCFNVLAIDLGLLEADATDDECERVWYDQLDLVFDAYANRRAF